MFPLAAEYSGLVKAVLAFSPGDYLEGGAAIKAAQRTWMPVFVSSATTLSEVGFTQPVFDAVASSDKVYFLPRAGSEHGSLSLIRAENPDGYEEVWAAVLTFLQRVVG